MDFYAIVGSMLLTMPIFLLSLTVHEAAHAVAAAYCGDNTATQLGRATLNPLVHIDPIGTLLMPGLSLLFGGIAFIGWAKPVPVNPTNFRNEVRDDIFVSVAGPASNIALSLLFLLGIIFLTMLNVNPDNGAIQEYLWNFTYYGILINVALAIFNMLPIPPLDGSHVLAHFLPPKIREQYRALGFYGIFVLLLLFNIVPGFRENFRAAIQWTISIYVDIATFFY